MKILLFFFFFLGGMVLGCVDKQPIASLTDKKETAKEVFDFGNTWGYKVYVDSVAYIVVVRFNGGVAIIKHEPK